METNNTTNDNVKLIVDKYNTILEEIKTSNTFSIDLFIERMEPLFSKAGYRELELKHLSTIKDYLSQSKLNILIIEDAGIGDFIIHTGVIREIRKNYPNANITLFTRLFHKDLAELCPYVDEIIYKNGWFAYNNFINLFKDFIKYSSILLKKKYNICFSFGLNSTTNLLMYMSGAKTRINIKPYISRYDEFFLGGSRFFNFNQSSKFVTNYFIRPTYRCHRVDIAFNLLEQYLNINIMNKDLEIWLNQDDINYAEELLKDIKDYPIYALCMGATAHRNRYPAEYYAKFSQLVLDKEKNSIFIILGGGSEDQIYSQNFLNTIPKKYKNNIINLINKISFRQSAAILKFCNMYIGNDTGTMHLAAAMKCPVLNPNPHAHSLSTSLGDCIVVYHAYNVPVIIVTPKNNLPGCEEKNIHHVHGCRSSHPHCIVQIKPETIYKGFIQLKGKRDSNPTIIY